MRRRRRKKKNDDDDDSDPLVIVVVILLVLGLAVLRFYFGIGIGPRGGVYHCNSKGHKTYD